MAAFEWTNAYSVNISSMDDQHKVLVGLLNKLDDAHAQGSGKQAFMDALGRLMDYVRTHFEAEEKLMQENDYPDYYDHRQAHIALTIKVAELQQLKDVYRESDTPELIGFLTQWLVGHIMGVDRRYGVFLNKKGIV